jgi:hypothetical protein
LFRDENLFRVIRRQHHHAVGKSATDESGKEKQDKKVLFHLEIIMAFVLFKPAGIVSKAPLN